MTNYVNGAESVLIWLKSDIRKIVDRGAIRLRGCFQLYQRFVETSHLKRFVTVITCNERTTYEARRE